METFSSQKSGPLFLSHRSIITLIGDLFLQRFGICNIPVTFFSSSSFSQCFVVLFLHGAVFVCISHYASFCLLANSLSLLQRKQTSKEKRSHFYFFILSL